MTSLKPSLIIALILSLTSLLPLALPAADFPKYGFQIDTLEDHPGKEPGSALIMLLPSSGGFAPNVNVQIQPFPKTIKEYVELSKGQFKQLKFIVIQETENEESGWAVEYKGTLSGKDLHFYARAVAKNGRVYLATATSTEAQWASVGETLRKNVDSLKTH